MKLPEEIRRDSILSDGEFLDQGRSIERSDGWSKFERFSQFHSNSSRLADLILRCSRWLMLLERWLYLKATRQVRREFTTKKTENLLSTLGSIEPYHCFGRWP